jgi:adenylate cyclase
MCFLCAGVCFLLYALRWSALVKAELWAKDLMISSERGAIGPDPRLVFIGIDQPSYAEAFSPEEIIETPILGALTNTFPWSRNLWAAAIDRLAGAGAKVVMLDLIFSSPATGDEALRAALDRHAAQVIVGANFLGGNKSVGESETILLPTHSVLSTTNGAPVWSDPRVGYVNIFADVDDVVRRAVFHVVGERGLPPGGVMDSLAARALEKFGAGHLVPVDGQPHLFRFSDAPGIGYKPIPFYEIFLPSHWTNNFAAGGFFKDKIIVIGPAANIFHDEHRTPFPGPAMLGPEIHLNVIGAALRGEFLGEHSEAVNRILILAAGLAALLLAIVIRGPIRRLLVTVALITGYFVLCWILFNFANFLLLAVTPMIALSTGTLAGFTYDFVLLRREKNRTRRTLERYVSKDVVREVLDNPETFLNTLGGVRKPVTILFSDVRGFTTMTESADEAQLVAQLKEYFTEMVRVVFAEHGSLDKFIGDAVMALWGSMTTEGVERDAQRAVAAALAMRKALAQLNISWSQRGIKELAFGIGINHGHPIVGNIGADLGAVQRMEVSVIGDAVNVASRLEGLTKEYQQDLLLGESMVPLVQGRFVLRTVGSVQVKGKTRPVRVFTVAADKQAGEQPPPWLGRYEEGIKFYHERKFAEGAEAFLECRRAQPGDYLCQLYLDECSKLLANPPGPEWDTVVVMKSK